jgi:hypothetical protein
LFQKHRRPELEVKAIQRTTPQPVVVDKHTLRSDMRKGNVKKVIERGIPVSDFFEEHKGRFVT